MLIATWANSTGGSPYSLSKAHLAPRVSEDHHSASRTSTTNQPSVTGVSPDPRSSSRAPGTHAIVTRRAVFESDRTDLTHRGPRSILVPPSGNVSHFPAAAPRRRWRQPVEVPLVRQEDRPVRGRRRRRALARRSERLRRLVDEADPVGRRRREVQARHRPRSG